MKLPDYLMTLAEGIDIKVCTNRGYVITPNCVRRCIRVPQEEKLVLFEIYSHYNDEKGYAFPTQQTLALYLGISASSVSKHLKSLEQKGFIKSMGGKGKSKIYFPSFDLMNNVYIILSEWFFFAIQVIRKNLHDSMGAEWANLLLQFVNIKTSTENDLYGKYLTKLRKEMDIFHDEIILDFLNCMKEYVEQITKQPLVINWEKEIKLAIEKKKQLDKSTANKRKRNRANGRPTYTEDYAFV
ncbi:helix-turn-helix domain-containing protein [Paenibacillus naphthalenovorans]|uniref:helix-turn-helix domain-containing protein n=1 Tax=Paenibacillus naphthalenovorans TaxID=162209 RepID=UPI0010F90FA6|nr:helix-turn-helix domain-containing protein [Paenibacillus naphthalenovorans]